MKILYWVEKFWPHFGGIETYTQQLIPALEARGHRFTMMTSGSSMAGDMPEMVGHLPVWRFPWVETLLNQDLAQIRTIIDKINQIVQETQPDLIHLNSTALSIFFYLRLINIAQIPTLLTLHMPLLGTDQPNSLVVKVLKRANHVVGVSQNILDSGYQAVPAIAERASVIHNALAMPPLVPTPLPFAPPVLLCMGRMVEQKGFDIAIDAFALILRHQPDAKLVLAGDGELRAELTRLCFRPTRSSLTMMYQKR